MLRFSRNQMLEFEKRMDWEYARRFALFLRKNRAQLFNVLSVDDLDTEVYFSVRATRNLRLPTRRAKVVAIYIGVLCSASFLQSRKIYELLELGEKKGKTEEFLSRLLASILRDIEKELGQ